MSQRRSSKSSSPEILPSPVLKVLQDAQIPTEIIDKIRINHKLNIHKIIISNLPEKITENEIKELFDKYGEIVSIELKPYLYTYTAKKTNSVMSLNKKQAILLFKNIEDANDAIRGRNNYKLKGSNLTVKPYLSSKSPV